MGTPISKLRRQLLGDKKVQPMPRTKRLVPVHEYPDTWPKTHHMKELEYRYHIKLEVVLFDGSLDDVARFFNSEVDRSTISKWRKKYNQYMEAKAESDLYKEIADL